MVVFLFRLVVEEDTLSQELYVSFDYLSMQVTYQGWKIKKHATYVAKGAGGAKGSGKYH